MPSAVWFSYQQLVTVPDTFDGASAVLQVRELVDTITGIVADQPDITPHGPPMTQVLGLLPPLPPPDDLLDRGGDAGVFTPP